MTRIARKRNDITNILNLMVTGFPAVRSLKECKEGCYSVWIIMIHLSHWHVMTCYSFECRVETTDVLKIVLPLPSVKLISIWHRKNDFGKKDWPTKKAIRIQSPIFCAIGHGPWIIQDRSLSVSVEHSLHSIYINIYIYYTILELR